jgi:hypothetical protein
MSDLLEILAIIVVSSVGLGGLPILLLYILRRLDAERKRTDELQARVEQLEAASGISTTSFGDR